MMNRVKYFLGNNDYCPKPFLPFSENVCDFLDSFSKELNSKNVFKDYPELKSLSFWCRKKKYFESKKKFFFKTK